MNLIDVKQLHFAYPHEPELLKGLDLTFDNRSTAIIGQNGSGKTTFVKLLKGLLRPSSGDILIHGLNTKETSVAKLAARIGLVFQNPGDQIFKSKVSDEVMFGPLNIGFPEDQANRMTSEALHKVGLESKVNANPYDLSFSERKLLTVASVLAMDPEIVILDEPTIAQDEPGRQLLQTLVRNLETGGKLVIAILHDMDFVAETFTRTIILQDGDIVMDDDTKAVFSKTEILIQAGLEPPHVTQLAKSLGYPETYLSVPQFIKDRLRGKKDGH
jgi:ABC-type cobalt transport system, ATPase component